MLFRLNFVAAKAFCATIALLFLGAILEPPWSGWSRTLALPIVGAVAAIAIASVCSLLRHNGKMKCPQCGRYSAVDYDGSYRIGIACRQCGRIGGNVFTDFRLRCEVPPDPTTGWARQANQPLVFDFLTNALDGTAIGTPVRGLSGLGAAEDKIDLEEGCLTYYSLGLAVWIDDQECVESIELFTDNSSAPEHVPFAGTGAFRSQTFRFGEITESQFVGLFGEPYWRDDDGAEVLLFYEFGDLEWQVEFNKKGRIQFFLATNEPLLKDEEQRTAYTVTKPWPPRAIQEASSDV